jgi:hypothetical protein
MSSADFDPEDAAQQRFASYGPSPLPNSRDDAVEKFIEATRSAGPRDVAAVSARASERGRRVLRAYAERTASLAVRRKDAQLLVRGVVALVMGGLDQNTPEALMVMPLIEHSAQLLDVDLASIFEQAASCVGHPGTVSLMLWLTRAPDDRTLESMGFVVTADEGGFRYKLNW